MPGAGDCRQKEQKADEGVGGQGTSAEACSAGGSSGTVSGPVFRWLAGPPAPVFTAV